MKNIINMKNTNISICLSLIIIFNCIWVSKSITTNKEGFIGDALGTVIVKVLSVGGTMFKPIIKGVKKAKGIVGKIVAVFVQFTILALTIIFYPFVAIAILYCIVILIQYGASTMYSIFTMEYDEDYESEYESDSDSDY